jgi:hypothetical protein
MRLPLPGSPPPGRITSTSAAAAARARPLPATSDRRDTGRTRGTRAAPLDAAGETIERDLGGEGTLLVVQDVQTRAAVGAIGQVLDDGPRLRAAELADAVPAQAQLARVAGAAVRRCWRVAPGS